MLKIAHSFILKPEIKNNISKQILDSWMLLYNRASYIRNSSVHAHDRMWHASNVDDVLTHYKNQDVDYLILNWFGVYCKDFGYWHNDCIKYIKELDSKDWIFAGQLISKEHQKKNNDYNGHFYPYPITAIINLKTWRDIGCPNWDNPSVKLFHVPKMSKKFIHGDYTPLELTPTSKHISLRNTESGNSFISKILDSGISVYNIPMEIRGAIIHTYPENDPSSWNNTMKAYMDIPVLLDGQMREFIKHVIHYKNLKHGPEDEGVFFLYCTENIFPNKLKNDAPINALQNVDTIIGPCSMFKAFILGSHTTTVKNYIHFDIFEKNVSWKRIITESWNGQYDNLVEVLNKLPNCDKSNFWNRSEGDIIKKQYDELLEYFETPQELEIAWQKYQKQNHKYIKANLLFSDKKIIDAIKQVNSKVVYAAIGDIPGYRINGLNYGIHNITNYTINHLQKIKDNVKELFIDIKIPINDNQIFGDFSKVKAIFKDSITRSVY